MPKLIKSRASSHISNAESPLTRASREKVAIAQDDSAGKCAEGFPKGSMSFLGQKEGPVDEAFRDSISQDGGILQDEVTRKRELALRQHAFFQLRLHIRRGTNLVAMDRCGKTKLYISKAASTSEKIPSVDRIIHVKPCKAVHNPTWFCNDNLGDARKSIYKNKSDPVTTSRV
jgi:hypothetical protein